jgi:TM2 domain-containing membrane protein YozV
MVPSKEIVENKEEELRDLACELPDDKRAIYYKQLDKRLKDPDTYAVLNYIFIAGLHHFYLGKWIRGLINITVFWLGVALLFFGDYAIATGVLILVLLFLFELYELFRSQTIVQHHNNVVMEDIYNEIKNS